MSFDPLRVRFKPRSAFAKELDTAVDAYFAEGTGRKRRDMPRMYLKSAIILTWFVSSWVVLVFFAETWWQGVLAAMSQGLSIAAIGMSVQHDANHGGYSRHKWVNRVMGATLDLQGVVSFVWRPKHNIGHHSYTNVEGVDYDIDFGVLASLSPLGPRRWWNKYQHYYLWFFYGFLLPKWVFHDDWLILKRRMIGVYKLPPPGKKGLAWFLAVKVFFVAWAIVIPAMYHPLWQVLVFHLIAAYTLGATLGTFFQLAHCTTGADFVSHENNTLQTDFATHQIATTVDFAPRSRILTWFCGGLNFQAVHHLYPKVCHLHYPALAPIVAEVAARHGLRYRVQPTFRGALASHFRHLRAMGEPLPVTALAQVPTV